ncbi:DMT family transporter [Neptunicella sp. SCSIO 80796]|uniref:DMT family transporter n=1 Tax=Neptunicella plasticusilytica TaxID=3117012 RepID=UPI003A4DD065
MNKSAYIWPLVILSTFFWGSNFNAGQAIADSVTPLTAAAERFFIAMLIFLLFRLIKGQSESSLQWRDAWILVPLGIIGVFGFNFAFFTALHTTQALNAALIMALSPMVSMLLAVWLLNARMMRYQLLGMLIAFVGVSLVITGGNFALLHVAIGDLWMLVACLAWSLYSVGSKRYASHIPSLQFARWTVSIGAVALIVVAFITDTPYSSIQQLSLQTHSILFYMALCGSVLAYIFWLRGIQVLGPDRSAIAFNLVPVFTLLISVTLGVVPDKMQIMGLLLVLSGMLVFSGWRPRRAKQVCPG